ncbi:MAG: WYL domain-containing protein [Verrucomicrobiae bacterium]|nr:WYL domain-containing protein [Verrucomicrobiae bacterium]
MPKVAAELHSRPPLERMMRIHERIKQGRFPNCNDFSAELEMSARTIKRDIDFMKYRLNLPIEYDARKYGYYYSAAVDQFPSVPVTEAEIFALMVAHEAVAQYRGTPFEQPLQTAFAKLTGQLDGNNAFTMANLHEALSFRPFAPEEVNLECFQVLTRGIKERQRVKFSYKNLGADQAQSRQVNPYHLACVDNRWYIIGFDVRRKGMRTFSLSRMKEVEVLADEFEVPAEFRIDDYLKGSFGIFKAEDDFEVVLEFDRWATDLVSERRWHPSQELVRFGDGRSRMTLRLNNIEEIERWVLGWGAHVTVVRPQSLADRILKVARELVQRYERLDEEAE